MSAIAGSLADSSTFIHQQIWVLEGAPRFVEGDVEHRLQAGDCLVAVARR